MKAAKEKATALAASIGQTIGKAVRITEQSNGSQGDNNVSGLSNRATFGGNFSETVATFAAGAIK